MTAADLGEFQVITCEFDPEKPGARDEAERTVLAALPAGAVIQHLPSLAPWLAMCSEQLPSGARVTRDLTLRPSNDFRVFLEISRVEVAFRRAPERTTCST